MKEREDKLQNALKRAILLAGSQQAIANMCGKNVRQGHVHNWLLRNKNKGIPVKYVAAVEKGLKGKMTKYDLRPDVFTN